MDRSLRAGAVVLRRTCARASTSAWTRAWVPSASTPAAAVADAASAHRARETLFSSPIRWGFAASHARGVHGSAARFVDERFTPVLETPEMDAEYEKLAEEIRRSPKKRQRFLLLEALRGTRLKPLIAAEHELLKEEGTYKPRALKTRVIDVNRTCKVTKGGGLMNFTALVVVGNGDGVVGFATGKGKDVAMAVEKAYSRASRSLVYIERFENSTIFHEQEAKHCKTKIVLMPAKAGTGLRCNQIVESICESECDPRERSTRPVTPRNFAPVSQPKPDQHTVQTPRSLRETDILTDQPLPPHRQWLGSPT